MRDVLAAAVHRDAFSQTSLGVRAFHRERHTCLLMLEEKMDADTYLGALDTRGVRTCHLTWHVWQTELWREKAAGRPVDDLRVWMFLG